MAVARKILKIVILSLLLAGTEAEVFTARSVTLTIANNLNIDLGRERQFRFNVAVKVDKERSDKNLAGPSLWKLSAWFGSNSDGSGEYIQFVDQVLTGSQSETAYKRSNRLNFNRVEYTLSPVSRVCSDLQYFCVTFGTDDPSLRNGGELTVAGFPNDNVLTECAQVPACTENPAICRENGVTYNVGDRWNPDSCTTCVCEESGALCSTETCPEMQCAPEYFITSPGVCCPACPSLCEYEGVSYDIYATWSVDVCTSCSCLESGEPECVVMTCFESDCQGVAPIYRPGECCTVCPLSCDEGGDVYPHLEQWKPNVCTTCSCYDGTTGCEVESCPVLPCEESKQIRAEDRCCSECAVDCVVSDDMVVAHGESFNPDVCTTCQCQNGSYICETQVCEIPECPTYLQVTRIDDCCPVCADACVHNGQEYLHSDRWMDDICTSCSCYDGESFCEIESCQPLFCPTSSQIQDDNKCCPECAQECTLTDDTLVAHGESWTQDVCTDCICQNGTFDCVTQVCSALECPFDQQITKPYNCCAQCAEGCLYDGVLYSHQSEWSPNDCTRCICFDGEERCSTVNCSPPFCGPDQRLLTKEGTCCPFCSEGDAVYVRSTAVKIKLNDKSKLKLEKKKPKFQFTPIITFDDSMPDITGINLWKLSVWFSSDKFGTNEKARIDQALTPDQASAPLVSNERLNFGATKLKFKTKKAKCKKLKYFCVRFGLSDNPLADGVTLFEDPSSVTQHCEKIPTCIDK